MPKIDKEIFYGKLAFYRKALETLANALKGSHDANKLYLDASAHRFIYCYELTWKNLRRLLRMRGVEVSSPVSTFRAAYSEGRISNKNLYEKMIEDRNIVTHEYFEEKAEEVYTRLPEYLTEMQRLSTQIEEIYKQEPAGI